MAGFTTRAILIRRLSYGDHDMILTLLTQEAGKQTVIAKHAKKSTRRFAGMLELFSEVAAVCSKGRGNMPVLQEVSLIQPYERIRADIRRTAFASYWAELLDVWLEAGNPQRQLYHLMQFALAALDDGAMPSEAVSILFQMRFLTIAGLSPNLTECCACRSGIDGLTGHQLSADLNRGGVVCLSCQGGKDCGVSLSKGTLKQLIWAGDADFTKAVRIRFTTATLREGLAFMERFVAYQLGRELKSLKFLRSMRSSQPASI